MLSGTVSMLYIRCLPKAKRHELGKCSYSSLKLNLALSVKSRCRILIVTHLRSLPAEKARK